MDRSASCEDEARLGVEHHDTLLSSQDNMGLCVTRTSSNSYLFIFWRSALALFPIMFSHVLG